MKRAQRTIILISLCNITFTPSWCTQDLHRYLWANYIEFRGNYGAAQKWYKRIFEAPNPSPYANKGYISFLFGTSDFKSIVPLIPSLDPIFEHDPEIQQLFALSLEKVGRQTEADNRFIKLSNAFKHDQTIVFQTANIYLRRKEPENALATIDALLNTSPKKPNNFIFHFLKSQIYVQLNALEKALESVKLCLQMHPQFEKGWLLLSLLQEQAGKLEDAIKGYTTFLEINGSDKEIEQRILQLTFKQKITQPNKHATTLPHPSLAKAVALFEQKNYAQALETVDQCLQKNPNDIETRLLKIQILSAMNNPTQAAELLKSWILDEPTNDTWFTTLHLLHRNGLTIPKAIALLQDIAQAQPDNLRPILYLSDLSTRTKHQDSALHYYKKAMKMSDDKRLKTKILFQMALIYYDQKKFSDMEKALIEGNNLGQDFPPLLNLLAYHYATEEKNLDEAFKMIEKALQKNKNNPHFLDTQAVVLLKQKSYEQALATFKKCIQLAPDDVHILTNLSKALYQMGDKNGALGALEKAQKLAKHDHEKQECISLLACWKRSEK